MVAVLGPFVLGVFGDRQELGAPRFLLLGSLLKLDCPLRVHLIADRSTRFDLAGQYLLALGPLDHGGALAGGDRCDVEVQLLSVAPARFFRVRDAPAVGALVLRMRRRGKKRSAQDDRSRGQG